MTNKPLYLPPGVRLVRLQPDEEQAPVTRAVLTCEGPCRPQWTAHRRTLPANLPPIPAGELVSEVRTTSIGAVPRYACEQCETARRWGQ